MILRASLAAFPPLTYRKTHERHQGQREYYESLAKQAREADLGGGDDSGGGRNGSGRGSSNVAMGWVEEWAGGKEVPFLSWTKVAAAAERLAVAKRGATTRAAFHADKPVTINSAYSGIDEDEVVAAMRLALFGDESSGIVR